AAAAAVHEDVHEPAFGRRLVLAGAEQADAVAHAAVAKLLHAQAGVDAAGEGDHAQEAAGRFGAQADRGAAVDVEPAFGDQVGVDHGVEVAVVLDVVDVAVDVVVLPAGGDGQEVAVVGARAHACSSVLAVAATGFCSRPTSSHQQASAAASAIHGSNSDSATPPSTAQPRSALVRGIAMPMYAQAKPVVTR